MNFTLKVIIGLMILYVSLVVLRHYNEENQVEGFSQSPSFITKHNKNIYDAFYCGIYDELMYDPNKITHETDEIIRATHVNKNSTILDIGCGPGHHVDEFQKRGFNIKGLDVSSHMVKYARRQYPQCSFQEGSILNPYIFEKERYSHLLCLYFTMYYFKDKSKFFGICNMILKPGGYLVVHMVDRELFDPMVSLANPLLLMSPQRAAKERITTSSVKFKGFQYKSKFDINGDTAVFQEDFVDDKTKKRRKNTHTLYMESLKTIVRMAKERGFSFEGRLDLLPIQYEHQYLYVFSKNL